MLRKIVSGGQAGADQAALDVAIKLNIPHGGWIPKGRLTEDGPLPDKYNLQEMSCDSYNKRTEQNVIDSDGTLIVSHGKLTGGSELTAKLATKHCKPYLHVDMDKMSLAYSVRLLKTWRTDNGIKVLNVAGSRQSGNPKIYDVTVKLLESAFSK
nr:putative molybdenum carrier protein [Desulfobulbaceae bacterium]